MKEKNRRLVAMIIFLTVMLHVPSVDAGKVVVIPLASGKKATGDAVAAEVLEDKTFSSDAGVGLDGAMLNRGAVTIVPGTTDLDYPGGIS